MSRAKIAIGIASRPEREAGAIGVIKSLAPYADAIVACFNNYAVVPPAVAKLPNVIPIIGKDYGAGGKFLVFEQFPDADYILCVDDDIYYPPMYVSSMVYAYRQILSMGGCIASLWGIIITPSVELLPSNASYGDVRSVCKICGFNCHVPGPLKIHIPGTGAMIVSPSLVNLCWSSVTKHKKGTDLVLAQMAKQHNVSCWHITLPVGVIASRAEAQIEPMHTTDKWRNMVRDCILKNRPWEY